MVDCRSRNCTTSSRATTGDSEIRSSGGIMSASSRLRARREETSFWTAGELGLARSTWPFNCSRSAFQFSSTKGCFLETSRTGSQPGQVELPHFSAAAHAVHQVERISFAADKSHDVTSCFRNSCSVILFHYTLQDKTLFFEKSCIQSVMIPAQRIENAICHYFFCCISSPFCILVSLLRSLLIPLPRLDARYSMPLLFLPAATSHSIKPGSAIFLLFLPGAAPTMSQESLLISPGSLIRNDLGSCFPFRETNSPRPGSNL